MVNKIRYWASPVFWARWNNLSTLVAGVLRPLSPPVLVVSLPRSGSSWVGEILGSSCSSLYLREPITQSYLATGKDITVFYVEPDSPPEEYNTFAERAFNALPVFRAGIIKEPEKWTLSKRRSSRVVIKEVNPLALPWIIQRFKPKIIFLVRHPAAVASSYYKLGWHEVSLERRLPPKLLSPANAVPKPSTDFWTQHACFQATALRIALNSLANYPDKRLIVYEQLCLDPIDSFRDLFAWSGLPWSEDVEHKILEKSGLGESQIAKTNNNYDTARNSIEMINSWRSKLSKQQISRLRDTYLDFNLPLYPADEWA